jgi:glycosyltransferase involved in cell wall biosynthesis
MSLSQNMRQPNVMVLIATTILGGPGKGVFQLLDRLKVRGVDYVLVAYKLKGSEDTEFIRLAKQKGYTLEIIEQSGIFNRNIFRSAVRVSAKYNINIIQSHGYKSHLVALYLHFYKKIRWLSFVHGWSSENFKVYLYGLLELFLVRFSDRVIAVSPSIQNTLNKWMVWKVNTILNAVDKNELPGNHGGDKLRENLDINKSDFVIGTVGRLSPEKGHELLIKAIAKIKNDKVKLLIVGDGPLKDDLLQLTTRLGVNNSVKLCGYDKNIRDYYEAFDLLILPSLKEGLPNVVLEAMVFGIPVISTDVGGVREIITDNENGWIIVAGSVDSISKKLDEVVNDKQRLEDVKHKAFMSVFPKFCPDNRASEIVKVYQELLS